MTPTVAYSIVVPTVGRASLSTLLRGLDADRAGSDATAPARVFVVDDRHEQSTPLELPSTSLPVEVVAGEGRGPAAARNAGWRRAETEWIEFLDDDVEPPQGWTAALVRDLADLPATVAASQGHITVPVRHHRRLTDWERNVRGLEHARWATADMAYRRSALEAVGGFDERFPRAYREDADLGLRVVDAGYEIVQGERVIVHPVRATDRLVSVRVQAGNRDDVLMIALHGPRWRARADAGRGRTGRHLLTTIAAGATAVAAATGRKRTAALAALAWGAGFAEFTARRVAPGPRTPDEVATMVATSAVLPIVATGHKVAGWLRLPRLLSDTQHAPLGQPRPWWLVR